MSMFSIDMSCNDALSKAVILLDNHERHGKIAAYRAINKTAKWLKTRTINGLSKQTGIQQKLIRKRLQILKAGRKTLKAMLKSNNQYIPARELGGLRQTAKGAKAGKFFYEGGFVSTMPSTGQTSIFKRKGKSRLPIRELGFYYGGFTKRIWDDQVLNAEVARQFEKFFKHEVNFLQKK